jgi:hypothetical protein
MMQFELSDIGAQTYPIISKMIFRLLNKFKLNPEKFLTTWSAEDLLSKMSKFVAFGHYSGSEINESRKALFKIMSDGKLMPAKSIRDAKPRYDVIEYLSNKARASLHYGLVCNYLQQYEEAK